MSNYTTEEKEKIQQLLSQIGKEHAPSMIFVPYDRKQVNLILWCDSFLMCSKYKDNFKILTGMNETVSAEEVLEYLNNYSFSI
jgi:hypothetical protein